MSSRKTPVATPRATSALMGTSHRASEVAERCQGEAFAQAPRFRGVTSDSRFSTSFLISSARVAAGALAHAGHPAVWGGHPARPHCGSNTSPPQSCPPAHKVANRDSPWERWSAISAFQNQRSANPLSAPTYDESSKGLLASCNQTQSPHRSEREKWSNSSWTISGNTKLLAANIRNLSTGRAQGVICPLNAPMRSGFGHNLCRLARVSVGYQALGGSGLPRR
jgi:hypothetical protein